MRRRAEGFLNSPRIGDGSSVGVLPYQGGKTKPDDDAKRRRDNDTTVNFRTDKAAKWPVRTLAGNRGKIKKHRKVRRRFAEQKPRQEHHEKSKSTFVDR